MLSRNLYSTNQIVFIHIPKCGGTSVDSAISNLYSRKQRFQLSAKGSALAAQNFFRCVSADKLGENLHRFRESILHYKLIEKVPYISGHFRFSRHIYEAYGENANFITIIRDPIRRWISHYFYDRYKSSNHFKINSSIWETIESDRGKIYGSLMVRFLAGDYNENDDIKEVTERAKCNLHLFGLVGFLDQLEDFQSQFHLLFGRKIHIPMKKVNPRDKKMIDQELNGYKLKKIEELCQPDIELFNYAKKAVLY